MPLFQESCYDYLVRATFLWPPTLLWPPCKCVFVSPEVVMTSLLCSASVTLPICLPNPAFGTALPLSYKNPHLAYLQCWPLEPCLSGSNLYTWIKMFALMNLVTMIWVGGIFPHIFGINNIYRWQIYVQTIYKTLLYYMEKIFRYENKFSSAYDSQYWCVCWGGWFWRFERRAILLSS